MWKFWNNYSNWNNPGNGLSKIRNMVYSSNELSFFWNSGSTGREKNTGKSSFAQICTIFTNWRQLASYFIELPLAFQNK